MFYSYSGVSKVDFFFGIELSPMNWELFELRMIWNNNYLNQEFWSAAASSPCLPPLSRLLCKARRRVLVNVCALEWCSELERQLVARKSLVVSRKAWDIFVGSGLAVFIGLAILFSRLMLLITPWLLTFRTSSMMSRDVANRKTPGDHASDDDANHSKQV
jgi:hypothetical protein